jgi:hypothetical protein
MPALAIIQYGLLRCMTISSSATAEDPHGEIDLLLSDPISLLQTSRRQPDGIDPGQ